MIVLLSLLIPIGAATLAVLRLLGWNARRRRGQTGRGNPARQILDERYVREELDREEYEQMRQDIETG